MEFQIFVSIAAFFWTLASAIIIAGVWYWRNPEFRKQRAALKAHRNKIKKLPKAY